MKQNFAFLFLVTSLFVSCMVSPVDERIVSNTADSFSFAGYTVTPKQVVALEAYAWDTNAWIEVKRDQTLETSSSLFTTTLYPWQTNATLASRFWKPGEQGAAARVRTRIGEIQNGTGNTFAFSFRTDLERCSSRFNSQEAQLNDFITECKSPRSPVAELRTRDYIAFGDIDLQIQNLVIGDVPRPGGTNLRAILTVNNRGSRGVITRISCDFNGIGTEARFPIAIGRNTTFTYTLDSIAGSLGVITRVVCFVEGKNSNGITEPAATFADNRAEVINPNQRR